MWDNPELLSYVAMCIRAKLRKDKRKPSPYAEVQAGIDYRIEQGEVALKELQKRIKELGRQGDWVKNRGGDSIE